ncbi:hypothetical protein EV188_102622 [Actinomycetospora succinea]|uniref:Uncharacterized protein n=1 Tax=Actinomycetospora succinea TaxID=663603 RepID=A0A4R6VLX1_9PSEU|nr:hypothetical protein [Actinomycetospora succinea]TDQ62965.1 hypothetical protein EV188_102622 [Actinomycetospora succinea]
MIVPEGTDVVEATASLLAEGIGDGLPVVPPTPSRVAAVLGDTDDPDAELGAVPPLFGSLTARLTATCCVLAGAPAGALPVVLTAATACLAPELNLLGVATTTGTAAVAMIVAGPVAARIGLTHGTGMLGPGPHTNGAVGRALALTLATAGGVQPGTTTMATTAQPARYTCCLAADPSGPWGTAPDSVTVLPIGGTAEVLPRDDRPDPDAVLDPLAEALAGAVRAAGDLTLGRDLTQAVVLPPEVAARLAPTFPDVADLVAELRRRGDAALGHRVGDVLPIVAGGPGVKMLHLPGWMGGSRPVTVRM